VLEIKNGRSTVRRDNVNANDILVRGQQMDMKIWTADKLNKILTTLFDEKPGQDTITRTNNASRATNDLVQVLKNEKLAAVADKEQVGIPRELVAFRGPFIYVHDMDEKVRPIMIREYPKVARRQDGEWPQFRSASIGKCPFVEDPVMRKELERERAQQRAQQLQQEKAARTKSVPTSQTLLESAKMEPPRRTSPRKVLREANQNTVVTQPTNIRPPLPHAIERQSSFPPMPEQPPIGFVKPCQMHLAHEPSASGIQRSAMTSAIQSQMISSAAATGMKATTSKEVNELKRKVLERTHTGSLSIGSISSSHQVNALAGALKNARAPAPQRAAKSKAQEKLGGIQEETDPYADDLEAQRQPQAVKKRKPAKREPKPGYCENCHDKYDDFEDVSVDRIMSMVPLANVSAAHHLTKTPQVCDDSLQLGRTRRLTCEAASTMIRLALAHQHYQIPISTRYPLVASSYDSRLNDEVTFAVCICYLILHTNILICASGEEETKREHLQRSSSK